MKIASSQMQFASSHASSQRHEVRESLRMWVGDRRPDFEGRGSGVRQSALPADRVSLSHAGRAAQSAEAERSTGDTDAVEQDPRLMLLREMIYQLTGVVVKIFKPSDMPAEGTVQAHSPPSASGTSAAAQGTSEPRPAGYGLEYDRHESYTETEQTDFSASGVVRTADGKEIAFDLSLSMSRSYHEESDISLRLGDATRQRKDPLVLNFSGTAAQLTDQRFSFDLDADGKDEQINTLAAGSGFLAMDRNGDGRINNGTELFGAQSGNGFADLAALDDDGNGWIDENDAAFDRLAVWTRDANGKETLGNLRQAGVGALNLSHVATPFDLKNSSNDLLGQIRATGVFLQENGKTGTMQQLDLTV